MSIFLGSAWLARIDGCARSTGRESTTDELKTGQGFKKIVRRFQGYVGPPGASGERGMRVRFYVLLFYYFFYVFSLGESRKRRSAGSVGNARHFSEHFSTCLNDFDLSGSFQRDHLVYQEIPV